MNTDVTHRIKRAYSTLSKSHKILANAVLHSYDKIAYMTATQFGRFAGVSESTVVRFAAALEFPGYIQFQRSVQELVRTRLTPHQRVEMMKKRFGRTDLLESVLESDIKKIRHTIESLNRYTFDRSVEAILNARRIYITGARGTEHIARLFHYNLTTIFDNVRFVQPTSDEEIAEQMVTFNERDVLVALSFPRYSSRIVYTVALAKKKKAKVIVFTDCETSPLAEFATYLIQARSDMAAYSDSLVAPLSIINAMIVAITHKRERDIIDRLDTLEKIWDKFDVYTKR